MGVIMAIRAISSEEIVTRMRELISRANAIQNNSSANLGLIGSISPEKLLSLEVGRGVESSDRLDFQTVLKDAVRGVSDAQSTAQSKAQAYQLGDDSTTLEDVMISIQKANLAMQGMVQVRNRLVEAYREVMNLQV
jgi:flagellar hook-basal body complex protein FliE